MILEFIKIIQHALEVILEGPYENLETRYIDRSEFCKYNNI